VNARTVDVLNVPITRRGHDMQGPYRSVSPPAALP
jgi:hypothetical protein